MGAPSANQVNTALPKVTGGILRAPLGTALPTNTTTALNAAFKALGLVGESGLTRNITKATNIERDWAGNAVKNLQTEDTETFGFTLIQSLDADVNKAVFGDANVTVTPGTPSAGTLMAIARNSTPQGNFEWAFEMFDGPASRRIVAPLAQLVLSGDIAYNRNGSISYPVTLTAFPDTSGNTSYEYTDDGVFIP